MNNKSEEKLLKRKEKRRSKYLEIEKEFKKLNEKKQKKWLFNKIYGNIKGYNKWLMNQNQIYLIKWINNYFKNNFLENKKFKKFFKEIEIKDNKKILQIKIFFIFQDMNNDSLGNGQCKTCGGKTKWTNIKLGFGQYCSHKCSGNNKEVRKKFKETSFRNRGTTNHVKSEKFKKKMVEGNLKKYGVENYFQSDKFRSKVVETWKEKYGVDNPAKAKEVKKKIKNTNLKKYGCKCSLYGEEVRKKVIKTNMGKYGVKNPICSEIVKIKIHNKNLKKLKEKILLFLDPDFELKKINKEKIELKHKKCGNIFIISKALFFRRVKLQENLCLHCNPIFYGPFSEKEKEVLNFIKSIYNGKIEENKKILYDKKTNGRKEIDIYLPELKLGIEFNGIYWHSNLHKNKNYHQDKYLLAKKQGIKLIQIWEDDWDMNKLTIKNIIKNILNKKSSNTTNKVIYGRGCYVDEVSFRDKREFLIENHLLGNDVSKINLGLFRKGDRDKELIGLMTFRKGGIEKGLENKGILELSRLCFKVGIQVVGGSEKLWKYFLLSIEEGGSNYDYIKENSIQKVKTYSDLSYFEGGVYRKLGFRDDGITGVNYYYFGKETGNIRKHRFQFRKDILLKKYPQYKIKINDITNKLYTEEEIMMELGFFKVEDVGHNKFIYNLDK